MVLDDFEKEQPSAETKLLNLITMESERSEDEDEMDDSDSSEEVKFYHKITISK